MELWELKKFTDYAWVDHQIIPHPAIQSASEGDELPMVFRNISVDDVYFEASGYTFCLSKRRDAKEWDVGYVGRGPEDGCVTLSWNSVTLCGPVRAPAGRSDCWLVVRVDDNSWHLRVRYYFFETEAKAIEYYEEFMSGDGLWLSLV